MGEGEGSPYTITHIRLDKLRSVEGGGGVSGGGGGSPYFGYLLYIISIGRIHNKGMRYDITIDTR